VIHVQGDHLFNDWRDAFAGLGEVVARASGKPPIGARIAATFAPMLASPKVDEARRFTVKCVGHPAQFDRNAYMFGHLKSDFKQALTNYALTRTIGEAGEREQAYRRSELGRSFRSLTQNAIDEESVGRFEAANPGQRMQVAGFKAYYLREAPQAFETLLNGPWEPAGF
jgi:hypothetical protein